MFSFLFHFRQTVRYRPWTLGYWLRFTKFVYARAFPKYVRVASSLTPIVMVIVHLPGRYFSGFWPQILLLASFSLLLEVWATESFFIPQVLFEVFRLILTVTMFWMVSILHLIPIPKISFPGPWELFEGHQLRLVLPLLSCSTAFFSFLARSFVSIQWFTGPTNPLDSKFFLFLVN